MKVVLIAGLPGSGKTYAAQEYGYEIVDDIKTLDRLAELLSAGRDVVVTDPNFCSADTRDRAVEWISKSYPAAEISWVFFESNASKARRNVAHRADGREVEATIRRYEKSYEVPQGYAARPIWQPK